MKIATAWQNSDPDALNLKRPELLWQYSGLLALHEAHSMMVTGRKEVRPIEEIAEVNRGWESSVYTEIAHLRWLKDYYSGLTPEQREKLERVAEAPQE